MPSSPESPATMPVGDGIRTGAQYLEGLRDGREIWLQGERVEDVTAHPGMGRGAHTLAKFLDKQFDSQLQDKLTYKEDGKRYAMSYHAARTGRHQTSWRCLLRMGNVVDGMTAEHPTTKRTAFAANADYLGAISLSM